MRFRRPLIVILLLCVFMAGFLIGKAAAVTVRVDYRVPIKSITNRFGMNEVDRANYFAGLVPGYSNSTILQNHVNCGSRYIRIWADTTDWAVLDARVKAVIDIGAWPYMCLEGYNGSNLQAYGDQCVSIVNRYRSKYNIGEWRWEILNEPNNNNRMSLSDYLNVYNTVEPRLRAAYAGIRVGGPATAGLALDWQQGLLQNARANGLQFVSWHRYGCWAEPYAVPDAELMAGTIGYEEDVDKLAAKVAQYRAGTPMICGELNMNAWAGVWNGSWNTDPRIKDIFNAPWYASALKHLFHTPLGNGASLEMFWEGTGDDAPGGCVGFGMWYAQQPTARGAVYYAKSFFRTAFPSNGQFYQCDEGGSPNLEAFATRSGNIAYLVLINKTSAVTSVQAVLNGLTVNTANLYTMDSAAYQAGATRVEALPSSSTQNITMNSYAVSMLHINAVVDTTPSAPPGPPTNVQISNPATGGRLNLSWTNPSDSDFAHVHIYRSADPDTLGPKIADEIAGTAYSDTTAINGTTYYYVIRAVDQYGNESSNTDRHSGKATNAGPISIISITSTAPVVGQGEAGASVSMTVRNTSPSAVRIMESKLTFTSGGSDISSYFTVTPTTSHSTLNPNSTHTFQYSIAIASDAPLGSVTVNGQVTGYSTSANLVVNDSFEMVSGGRPTGWTPWSGVSSFTDTADNTTRTDGICSYKLTISNSSGAGAALTSSTQATCLSSTVYICGCTWKTGGVSSVGKTLIINEFDSSGNPVNGNWLWLDHVTSWNRGSITFTTRPNTAKLNAELRLSINAAGLSENAWWDMVYIINANDYLEDTEANTPLQWTIISGMSPAWSYHVGSAVKGSPASLNGVVYIGAEDGYFYAIQGTGPGKGSLLWRGNVAAPIRCRPCLYNNTAYLTTTDGYLHALALSNGAEQAGYPVMVGSTGLATTPAVINGNLYVASNLWAVYRIRAATGEILSDTGGFIDSEIYTSPSVPGVDFVWVVSNSGMIYRLSSDLQSVLWVKNLVMSPVNCSPTIYNGCLYQADSQRKIQCIAAWNGSILWGPIYPSGKVDDTLWVDESSVYGAQADGKIGAWDALTGAVLPGFPVTLIAGPFGSAPVAVKRIEAGSGTYIYVGSPYGRFFAVKAENPSERWVWKASAAMNSSPAATGTTANDFITIGCSDGYVYGFPLK